MPGWFRRVPWNAEPAPPGETPGSDSAVAGRGQPAVVATAAPKNVGSRKYDLVCGSRLGATELPARRLPRSFRWGGKGRPASEFSGRKRKSAAQPSRSASGRGSRVSEWDPVFRLEWAAFPLGQKPETTSTSLSTRTQDCSQTARSTVHPRSARARELEMLSDPRSESSFACVRWNPTPEEKWLFKICAHSEKQGGMGLRASFSYFKLKT